MISRDAALRKLKNFLRKILPPAALTWLRLKFGPFDDLTKYAIRFGTDKWGSHFYTPHYHRYLSHLRKKRFTLLEIGIGGYEEQGKGGESLRMWREYFPKAQIVGLDIVDKQFVASNRIRPYVGSQTDPEVIDQIFHDFPDIKVVVDDGSHRPEHIRESFRLIIDRLPADGIYIIEDTQTSYWPKYGGSLDRDAPETTMAMVKGLIDGLNHEEFLDDYMPTTTDRTIMAIHCFHNLVIIEKGSNDEGSNIVRRKPGNTSTRG